VELNKILKNLKLKKMSMISVIISSLLFFLINDKLSICSFIHNLRNIHIQSPESIFIEAVNIGKILSLQYSTMLGIGYIFFELATFVTIAIAICVIFRNLIGFEVMEGKREDVLVSKCSFQTNDIYLQTSKFIC